jgi:hypothetical protein
VGTNTCSVAVLVDSQQARVLDVGPKYKKILRVSGTNGKQNVNRDRLDGLEQRIEVPGCTAGSWSAYPGCCVVPWSLRT